MSFLLDTDICSYHLKKPRGLTHRFVQHSGALYLSTIVLAELFVWAHQRRDPASLISRLTGDLLPDVVALDFDSNCAERFGQLKALMLRNGISVGPMDLLIASVALVHDLTLVTHNTSDYRSIPGLRLEDWIGD